MAKSKMPAALRAYLRKIGSTGGRALVNSKTPEQRRAWARAAAAARWSKRKDPNNA